MSIPIEEKPVHPEATPSDTLPELAVSSPSQPSWLRTFFLGVGSTIILVLIVGIGVIRSSIRAGSDSAIVVKAAEAFNLAAATVYGTEIPYADYVKQVSTLKKFYAEHPELVNQSPGQYSDKDIANQVMTRLMVNTLVAREARKFNLAVTGEELTATREEILGRFPNEDDARTQLEQLYGWTLEEYMEKVIRPGLREEKLAKFIEDSTDDAFAAYRVDEVSAEHLLFLTPAGDEGGKIKTRAQSSLSKIKKGKPFADVAAEIVAAEKDKEEPAVLMEDLEWFGKGVMVPAFEDAAFAMEVDAISDLVTTDYGYHIIHVKDKRSRPSYPKYMDDTIMAAKVRMLIRAEDPREARSAAAATAS